MKNIITFCTCILTIAFFSTAQTNITGDIGGQLFEKEGSPYIVDGDVVVPEGQEVVVKEGVVFLFNSFAGINVYGDLYVEGTEEEPVLFTSVNDAAGNPASEKLAQAFDWNGIKIDRNAGEVKFRNFKVMYSVYGIKSGKENIVLFNGVFKDNGQFHFTINDEIQMVEERIYYTYGVKKEEPEAGTYTVDAPVSAEPRISPEDSLFNKRKKRKKIIALSTMGVGVASGIAAIVCNVQSSEYYDKYQNTPDVIKLNEYYDKSVSLRNGAVGLGVTAGLAITTSVVLFIVKVKKPKRSDLKKDDKKKKKVSLYLPVDRNYTGVGLSFNF